MSTGVRRRGGASANQDEERHGSGDELDAFLEEELQRRPEVRIINKYAAVMAYIRIGVKGIGPLALLWATVVLLGGFVSSLKQNDFWYLTIIAFLQAAGVFDAMGDARFAFLPNWIVSPKLPMGRGRKRKRHILDIVLFVVFTPMVHFLVLGPLVCIVLSVIRVFSPGLDYSEANLKRALKLFYCLSIVHGTICLLCMLIETVVDGWLMKTFSRRHGLSPEVLAGYLHGTKQMCLNDPTSAESWNFITYGARLLDSPLPEDYAAGGRILTSLIDQGTLLSIRRLLNRSPRQRIQKLIGTLAWRSPAEREMRWFAARIMEHLTSDLNLAHFPGALECISSLFDNSYHTNGDQEALHLPFVIGRSNPTKRISLVHQVVANAVKALSIYAVYSASTARLFIFLVLICLYLLYKYIHVDLGTRELSRKESGEDHLVMSGLRILENLAHDRHNCTLIYNTKDILSKIVAPISSNKLVEDCKSSAAWIKVVDESLKVVSRLMGSSGGTGKKMRSLIANNRNAVTNLEAVLDMDMKSNDGIIELQMPAIEVLTQLALHLPYQSTTGIKEKLIRKALDIFLTKDWMEAYLIDEKRKINQPTTIQQNIVSRPPMQTRLDNLVKIVSGARAKEKMAQQDAEARAGKKMKEAQETANRLKEKAGEALAMLSSDSEDIKSFTGHLTELLDLDIKTINCEISAGDTVEINISTGSRISAAIILKHLRNDNMQQTLQKVLAELLQVEASSTSTPRCWARLITAFRHIIGNRAISCIRSIRNDIEQCATTGCLTATANNTANRSDGGKDRPSTSPSHHIQKCGNRRLQAELLSLVAAIRPTDNLDFAEVLISHLQPDPDALEKLGVRLKKIVEDNMHATPACLAIQKLTCKMITDVLQHDELFEVIDKHKIIDTLLEASKEMAGLESSMLFAGVRQDCHGVPLKPLLSVLAKNAEDVLTHRKQALVQGINNAPAGVSTP